MVLEMLLVHHVCLPASNNFPILQELSDNRHCRLETGIPTRTRAREPFLPATSCIFGGALPSKDPEGRKKEQND